MKPPKQTGLVTRNVQWEIFRAHLFWEAVWLASPPKAGFDLLGFGEAPLGGSVIGLVLARGAGE